MRKGHLLWTTQGRIWFHIINDKGAPSYNEDATYLQRHVKASSHCCSRPQLQQIDFAFDHHDGGRSCFLDPDAEQFGANRPDTQGRI